jgi:hypothetical protein
VTSAPATGTQVAPGEPASLAEPIDSVTASRAAAVLFLASILVGILCGLARFLFVAASHYGIELLWHRIPEALPGIPAAAVSIAVVGAMTLLATGIVVASRGRPADMGRAEAEFDREGRIEYRHLPAGIGFSLSSLWSGAAIGPEAALIDLNGAIGTWLGDRFSMGPEQVRTLAYAGVAGAFGAFFGAAPVGALLAAELISPKAVSISRTFSPGAVRVAPRRRPRPSDSCSVRLHDRWRHDDLLRRGRTTWLATAHRPRSDAAPVAVPLTRVARPGPGAEIVRLACRDDPLRGRSRAEALVVSVLGVR